MDIPQIVFDTYYDMCDDMIDLNFGINCKLYYVPTKTICINCHFNQATGKSSNIYKSGGPISFTDTICPYCNGDGFTVTDVTETIKLRVYFNKKNWVKISIPVNIADSSVQIIGHIRDMPKIRRATKIEIDSDGSGYDFRNYELAGEPLPHGFRRNKYFIGFLNRIQ